MTQSLLYRARGRCVPRDQILPPPPSAQRPSACWWADGAAFEGLAAGLAGGIGEIALGEVVLDARSVLVDLVGVHCVGRLQRISDGTLQTAMARTYNMQTRKRTASKCRLERERRGSQRREETAEQGDGARQMS